MNATALTATDVSEEKKDSLSLHDAVILCDEETLRTPELIDVHDVNESPVEQNDALWKPHCGDSSIKLKQDQSLIMNYSSINALIFYNREEVTPVVHNQNQLFSYGRNCSMPEYDLLNKEKLDMVKARAKLIKKN